MVFVEPLLRSVNLILIAPRDINVRMANVCLYRSVLLILIAVHRIVV